MSQRSKYNSAYVYVLCCIAALAGLMFGYSTAVITGVVLPLQQYYQLTPTETGWAVSSIVIGCIIGALVGGKIADKLGRKPALLIIAIIFIASSLGAAMSESFMIFSLSRIVCGLRLGWPERHPPCICLNWRLLKFAAKRWAFTISPWYLAGLSCL